MAQEILGEILRFTEQLVSRAELELDVSVEPNQDQVVIELSGLDTDLVLTENAKILHAVNHLVSQIYYRKAQGQYRFVVECGGYRVRRTRELELLAGKAAEQVQRSGQPFHFQSMPASDRRIIHLCLADQREVRTESDGRGMHRRVVVIPEA